MEEHLRVANAFGRGQHLFAMKLAQLERLAPRTTAKAAVALCVGLAENSSACAAVLIYEISPAASQIIRAHSV